MGFKFEESHTLFSKRFLILEYPFKKRQFIFSKSKLNGYPKEFLNRNPGQFLTTCKPAS
jgi:hypothetical protein